MTTRDFTMIADDELKAQAEKLYNSGFRVEVVNSQSVCVSLNRVVGIGEVWLAIDNYWNTALHLYRMDDVVLALTETEAARLGLWSE